MQSEHSMKDEGFRDRDKNYLHTAKENKLYNKVKGNGQSRIHMFIAYGNQHGDSTLQALMGNRWEMNTLQEKKFCQQGGHGLNETGQFELKI